MGDKLRDAPYPAGHDRTARRHGFHHGQTERLLDDRRRRHDHAPGIDLWHVVVWNRAEKARRASGRRRQHARDRPPIAGAAEHHLASNRRKRVAAVQPSQLGGASGRTELTQDRGRQVAGSPDQIQGGFRALRDHAVECLGEDMHAFLRRQPPDIEQARRSGRLVAGLSAEDVRVDAIADRHHLGGMGRELGRNALRDMIRACRHGIHRVERSGRGLRLEPDRVRMVQVQHQARRPAGTPKHRRVLQERMQMDDVRGLATQLLGHLLIVAVVEPRRDGAGWQAGPDR